MELSLTDACQAVADGSLVVYPTETLWGIGGNARDADVLHRVLAAKGILTPRPVPVLAATRDHLTGVTREVAGLDALAHRFWPGSLTLVLPNVQPGLSHLAGPTGGIGVRISAHPVAQALADAAGGLLLSTSANLTGAEPPARRADVDARLLARTAGAVAWEEPAAGAPSTLLVWDRGWKLVRVGAVSAKEVADALASEGLGLGGAVP